MRVGLRRPAYRWALGGAVIAIVLALVTTKTLSHAAENGRDRIDGDPSDLVVSLLWRVPTDRGGTAPPAVTPDGVFLGGAGGLVRAFAPGDGRPEWTITTGSGSTAYVNAARGTVFAATGDGSIVAVDAVTGAERWNRSSDTTFSGRPAVGADRVYASGHDALLYAYRSADGRHRWRLPIGGAIRGSPAVIGDVAVVAGDDGRLYLASSSGRLLWKPRIGKPADGPAVVGDAACVPLTDGSVRCVRATDGTVLARITLPGTRLSNPTGGGGVVVAVGADGAVGAWDTVTGIRRWLFRPEQTATAGHLLQRNGQVVVAYPDGLLTGLDPATGARRWSVTLTDHFDTPPRIDDVATYLVGRTGMLYALQTPGPSGTAERPPAPSGSTATPATVRPPPVRPPSTRPGTPSSSTPSPSGGDGGTATPTEPPTGGAG